MENKKSLREALLYDDNDHIAITILENLLEEISEETMYLFQNIFSRLSWVNDDNNKSHHSFQ